MGSNALLSEAARHIGSGNVLEILMQDQRRVQALFAEFQSSTALVREKELAFEMCEAIRLHAEIEEEFIYPALAAASRNEQRKAPADLHAMRELIEELERAGPTEDTFYAKVYVLCQMFLEHVKEEQAPRGLFAHAARAGLDLLGLGNAVRERRQQRRPAALGQH